MLIAPALGIRALSVVEGQWASAGLDQTLSALMGVAVTCPSGIDGV